jgi:hypothetical protein
MRRDNAPGLTRLRQKPHPVSKTTYETTPAIYPRICLNPCIWSPRTPRGEGFGFRAHTRDHDGSPNKRFERELQRLRGFRFKRLRYDLPVVFCETPEIAGRLFWFAREMVETVNSLLACDTVKEVSRM